MLIYLPISILLALVDYIRIRQRAGQVRNINHKVSGGLAVIAAIGLWLAVERPLFGWGALLYLPGCMAARLLVYDVALNLMRGLPADYLSASTDANTDGLLSAVPFWTRRIIGAAILLGCLAVKYFVL